MHFPSFNTDDWLKSLANSENIDVTSNDNSNETPEDQTTTPINSSYEALLVADFHESHNFTSELFNPSFEDLLNFPAGEFNSSVCDNSSTLPFDEGILEISHNSHANVSHQEPVQNLFSGLVFNQFRAPFAADSFRPSAPSPVIALSGLDKPNVKKQADQRDGNQPQLVLPHSTTSKSSRKSNTNTKVSAAVAIIKSNSRPNGQYRPFNADFSISQQILLKSGKTEFNSYYGSDSIGAALKGQFYLNCKHSLAVKLESKSSNVAISQMLVHIDNKLLYDLSKRGENGFSLIKNNVQLKSVKKEVLKCFEIEITIEYSLDGVFFYASYEQSLTVCGHDFIRQEKKKLAAI